MFKINKKNIITKTLFLFVFSFTISLFVLDYSGHHLFKRKANEICLRLEGDKRNFCLAAVNQNQKFCYFLKGDQEKFCSAIARKDVDYCNEINKEESRESCYNTLVLLTDKAEYCEKTQNVKGCYFSYLKSLHFQSTSKELKENYCDQVKESEKDTCLALMQEDKSLCHGRLACLNLLEKDLYICKGITGDDKFECFQNRALLNKDIDFCEKIENVEWKDSCYFNYTLNVEPKISFCDKIKNNNLKTNCYLETAINFSK
jgi:hypothetical protein